MEAEAAMSNACVRLNTYCSAGVKKGLFIFVCEIRPLCTR